MQRRSARRTTLVTRLTRTTLVTRKRRGGGEANGTVRTVLEKGFYLDEETYVTISMRFKKEKMDSDCAALNNFYHRMLEENATQGAAKKVVRVVLASKWGDEVANGSEKLNIQLSDNF
ncbi:hypothetical protein HN873_036232, partial [Arachis hypogaea]